MAAFCTKCGAPSAGDTAFCTKCAPHSALLSLRLPHPPHTSRRHQTLQPHPTPHRQPLPILRPPQPHMCSPFPSVRCPSKASSALRKIILIIIAVSSSASASSALPALCSGCGASRKVVHVSDNGKGGISGHHARRHLQRRKYPGQRVGSRRRPLSRRDPGAGRCSCQHPRRFGRQRHLRDQRFHGQGHRLLQGQVRRRQHPSSKATRAPC